MLEKIPKIKTRTLAFAIVVPLLTATSLITAPCPVCNGTGNLATTPGMDNVEISQLDIREWRITRDGCGLFILYYYDVNMTIFNKNEDAVKGWLKLELVDITKGDWAPVIDTQYHEIELDGLSGSEIYFTVVFGTGMDAWGQSEVRIEIMTGDIPDSTCKGSGKVASNTWLFINSLKDKFVNTIQKEFEYKPPQIIDWEDYYYFDA
ncbi:MAG: hypothetical protein WC231_01300 [Dehalococcoidales bacterium]|jgi:hypothetical protein